MSNFENEIWCDKVVNSETLGRVMQNYRITYFLPTKEFKEKISISFAYKSPNNPTEEERKLVNRQMNSLRFMDEADFRQFIFECITTLGKWQSKREDRDALKLNLETLLGAVSLMYQKGTDFVLL